MAWFPAASLWCERSPPRKALVLMCFLSGLRIQVLSALPDLSLCHYAALAGPGHGDMAEWPPWPRQASGLYSLRLEFSILIHPAPSRVWLSMRGGGVQWLRPWALGLDQPAFPAAGCVPGSKSLRLREPQFPPRSDGPHSTTFSPKALMGLLRSQADRGHALDMVPKQQ